MQQIVSLDGVFGLCRKKSAGKSARPPLLSGVFFEDQEIVDKHVSGYDAASHVADKVCAADHMQTCFQTICVLRIQGCHEFLAGDAIRSKSRYAALDETAVFGSICRHEFPQRFISMKHGER